MSSGVGIAVLVLSPILYFLLVLYSRVLLEFVVVVFRIYENTAIMAGVTGAGPGASPAPPTFGHPSTPAPPPESPSPPGPRARSRLAVRSRRGVSAASETPRARPRRAGAARQ